MLAVAQVGCALGDDLLAADEAIEHLDPIVDEPPDAYRHALRHLALVPDRYAGIDVRDLEARVHAALRDPNLAVAWPATEAAR